MKLRIMRSKGIRLRNIGIDDIYVVRSDDYSKVLGVCEDECTPFLTTAGDTAIREYLTEVTFDELAELSHVMEYFEAFVLCYREWLDIPKDRILNLIKQGHDNWDGRNI